MPELLAIAEYITKTLAICVVCGNPANRTYRKKRRGGRVLVGGADLYEARCRRCFELGRRVEAPLPHDATPAEVTARAPRARARREPSATAPRARRTREMRERQAVVTASPSTGGNHVAPKDRPRRRGRRRRGRAARGVRAQG
jgi:hypothetical protein